MGEQLENLLKEGAEEYQKEEDDLPSGPSFMLQLQNAELAVSSTGKAMVKRHHLIIDGEFEGVGVYDNLFPLVGGYATKRFKDWCLVMGFDPPATSMDIEETVAAILAENPVYMASIAVSKGYTNVTVTKLLEEGSVPSTRNGGPRKTKKAEPKEPESSQATEPEPEPEIGKGDTVTFTDDDGDEVTGTVTKVENGKADIDTPNADYVDVPIGSLTAEPPEPEPQADEELVDLIALAQANSIDVSDDTEKDDLVTAIKAHRWDKDQLTDDEVTLLEGVGVKFKAKVRPAAKPKAAAKKTKKTAKRR